MPESKERTIGSRSKAFALRVIGLYSSLPKSQEAQILGKQLLRSGTSVGAHYREATRARSRAEFVSKIGGGLQEFEETLYWLEILKESGIMAQARIEEVYQEANELMAIPVTSVKTAKRRSISP